MQTFEDTESGSSIRIEERVAQAVSPVLERDGYDLVLVEYLPAGHILRLYIDHEGGVSIDDCSKVSHTVGDILDGEGVTEAIDGSFNLEVSSPGLD